MSFDVDLKEPNYSELVPLHPHEMGKKHFIVWFGESVEMHVAYLYDICLRQSFGIYGRILFSEKRYRRVYDPSEIQCKDRAAVSDQLKRCDDCSNSEWSLTTELRCIYQARMRSIFSNWASGRSVKKRSGYECKTYILDKHISRKSKMQKRAHIDHLVDYETRNIFRIWISS